jgi:hypothetical protein
MLHVDRAIIDNVLYNAQYGVGKGTEAAFHSVQRWVDESAADNDVFGLLLMDFENAFNSGSRAKILDELFRDSRLKPLWGIAHMTLGSPSNVKLFGHDGKVYHTCVSAQGVRQGSVLASFAFALLINGSLRSLAAHVNVTAYVDDVTILVRSRHISEAGGIDAYVDKVSSHFTGTCLKLNSRKTILLRRPGAPSFSKPSRCVAADGVTRLLGGPIGWLTTPEATRGAKEYISKRFNSAASTFALAHQFANPLLKIAVARLCTEGTVGFLLRVTPPELCADAAAEFDKRLRSFTLSACGAPDAASSDKGWSLACLPEGLGLHPAVLMLRADAHGSSRRGDHSFSAALKQQAEQNRERLKASLTPKEAAFVTACCAPLAPLWRRPEPWRTPIDPRDMPPAAATQSSLRLALILPDEHQGSVCSVCGKLVEISAAEHALTSSHGQRTPPHSGVQRALRGLLTDLGLSPTMREKPADDNSNERADVEVVIGSSHWALEVMVPCPAAARWAAAAQQPAGVANAAAAAKEAEYEFLSARGVSVAAIVVDTAGGIAANTLSFLSHAIRSCAPTNEWGPRLEAAVVRLQFGMVAGLQQTFAEQVRATRRRGAAPAAPLMPIVTTASALSASREARVGLAR